MSNGGILPHYRCVFEHVLKLCVAWSETGRERDGRGEGGRESGRERERMFMKGLGTDSRIAIFLSVPEVASDYCTLLSISYYPDHPSLASVATILV